MSLSLYQVDTFTDRPFAGNPAAVCLLDEPANVAWMQSVAAEMNLSETAFLVPAKKWPVEKGDRHLAATQEEEGSLAGARSQSPFSTHGYSLRWFTPIVEVDLCGHATLASAHVLWESGRLPPDQVARFHTRSGELTASREGDWITLDLPAFQTTTVTPPADLLEGLGVTPVAVALVSNGQDHLVEMESEEAVRQLRPDFCLWRRMETGVICTARADDPQVDFVSRYFAPSSGIEEDPVTGYAHCVLGPYWQERLGKSQFLAHQISQRGGVLRVQVQGERIALSGQAVTNFTTEITEDTE